MVSFQHKPIMADNPHYNPERLLDTMRSLLRAENDRQLAAILGADPPQICKIRKRRVPVAAALLISMHEETGLSLRHLRALMGDYRPHTGAGAKHPTQPPLHVLESVLQAAPQRLSAHGAMH